MDVFENEYVPLLRKFSEAHVVMLIDFDDDEDRLGEFTGRIPNDVKPRVFVVGSKDEPETLKRELNMRLEEIGRALAQDCIDEELTLWRHSQLVHNESELQRLLQVVKPILFGAS